MRIQHNIMAMNAYRNYNTNTSALSKNLEKLSSGYKINRAGDDAAGLAISEKMRAQITGLNAASKNVKDGISLVKTAEGAMQEIQDMLNRMDYLATQSANGTYQNEVDRENLNKEMSALKEEINRIADSANFNGIKLLDGSLDPVKAAASANAAAAAAFTSITVSATQDHEATAAPQKMKFELDLSSFKAINTGTNGGTYASVTITGITGVTITGTATTSGAVTFSINGVTQVSFGGASFSVSLSGTKLTFEMVDNPTTAWNTALGTVAVTAGDEVDVNFGESLKYHVTQDAIAGGNPDQAQGNFDLANLAIKDGSQLKIGDTTYTFKVGANSSVSGDNVVDLSDLEVGTDGKLSANDLKTAAARLSGVANGVGDFLVTNDANSTTIHLTERITDDGKSNPDYDLAGPDKTNGNATWKRKDGTSIVSFASEPPAAASASAAGLTLQIGDTSDSFNQLQVKVGDMHVKAMGKVDSATGKVTGKTINDIDILNPQNASEAIDVIKGAINYVSSIRGDLGAVQNRLEHTANNLSVMAENIQDAESTIRDTDVAEEMMAYTKNNILIQSAQAMLAQANAVPQGVLQLLG